MSKTTSEAVTIPTPGAPEAEQELPQGLLIYEHAFVLDALGLATEATRHARQEYKDAIENSGGDWVFDDTASQIAMNEKGMREANERYLRQLSRLSVIDSPAPDLKKVVPGSRVNLVSNGFEDAYDVLTRRIPGFPHDPQVFSTLSAESEMGRAVMGAVIGATIHWTNQDGRNFTGQVLSVDQTAQREFYTKLGFVE